MKRWIVLIVTVIVLTAAVTFMTQNVTNSELGPTAHAVNESKGPQPKVEIGGPLLYEFGKMSQFRKSSHVWEVKNVGNADLEMWMESSTCSCTIAKLATPPDSPAKTHVKVKPNETTPIELEWDTKQFQNEYSKGATIGTNDPRRPSFALSVKGVVYPPVMVFPPEMITLNGISNEEVTRTMVAVYSMDMPTMKVTKISTGRPEFFTTKQSPMTAEDRKNLNVPAGGYRIDVEVKPGLPLGRFSDALVIETDNPLQKETKVSIHGYATGPISVIPEKLSMRGVSGKNGATHSLSLLVRGGKDVLFEVVQKPDDRFDIQIARNDAAPNQKGRWRLTLTIPPGTPPAHIEKEIILKTDHPSATEIKIPVSIIITNSSSS
jgi:hypothetical protein